MATLPEGVQKMDITLTPWLVALLLFVIWRAFAAWSTSEETPALDVKLQGAPS